LALLKWPSQAFYKQIAWVYALIKNIINSRGMNFDYAKRQFEENIQLFSNPQTNPENFNLYNGLRNLAIGLEELEQRISRIEEALKKRS